MHERGAICYATVVGGIGHDQGTRPVLIIGNTEVGARTGETLVLPISHVEPRWSYPLSWQIPGGKLAEPSWVLISRPRAALIERLRDQVAILDDEHMDQIVAGLLQLIGSG